jgi:nucleoid-associated protein YejK
MHPFLDVSKLTDEEIIERLGKAYTYMNAQVALGHDPTVRSIKEVIQSLEDERNSRMKKNMDQEYNKKFPDALKPIELGKLED